MLERANVLDMEIKLLKNRLRWVGHICRMNDTRPVKALLFGELEGSRKVGRPLLCYMDTCKIIIIIIIIKVFNEIRNNKRVTLQYVNKKL